MAAAARQVMHGRSFTASIQSKADRRRLSREYCMFRKCAALSVSQMGGRGFDYEYRETHHFASVHRRGAGAARRRGRSLFGVSHLFFSRGDVPGDAQRDLDHPGEEYSGRGQAHSAAQGGEPVRGEVRRNRARIQHHIPGRSAGVGSAGAGTRRGSCTPAPIPREVCGSTAQRSRDGRGWACGSPRRGGQPRAGGYRARRCIGSGPGDQPRCARLGHRRIAQGR